MDAGLGTSTWTPSESPTGGPPGHRDLELRPWLEPPVLKAYGVAPDPDRTRYYRALYDLVS